MKETKLDKVKKYCYANTDLDKKTLIKRIMKQFELTESTAQSYYYEWKAEFLETENCIPTLVPALNTIKKPKTREKIVIIDRKEFNKEKKGEYVDYIFRKNGVEVNGILFKSKRELEKFRQEQFKIAYQQLSEIESKLEILEGMGLIR